MGHSVFPFIYRRSSHSQTVCHFLLSHIFIFSVFPDHFVYLHNNPPFLPTARKLGRKHKFVIFLSLYDFTAFITHRPLLLLSYQLKRECTIERVLTSNNFF